MTGNDLRSFTSREDLQSFSASLLKLHHDPFEFRDYGRDNWWPGVLPNEVHQTTLSRMCRGG